MKTQILFSGEYEKNFVNLSSAELPLSVLSDRMAAIQSGNNCMLFFLFVFFFFLKKDIIFLCLFEDRLSSI